LLSIYRYLLSTHNLRKEVLPARVRLPSSSLSMSMALRAHMATETVHRVTVVPWGMQRHRLRHNLRKQCIAFDLDLHQAAAFNALFCEQALRLTLVTSHPGPFHGSASLATIQSHDYYTRFL
jgi:hypothetical protein